MSRNKASYPDFISLDMGGGHIVTIDAGQVTEVNDITSGVNAWLPRFGAITREMIVQMTTRWSDTAGYPQRADRVDRMWTAVEWLQNEHKQGTA